MDIRVLCLHGGGQTGRILRSQLYHLEERLAKNHHVELVYVESPISDWDMEKEVGEQSQGDIQISSSFEQLNLNSKTSSQPAEKMNPILDNKNDNLSFSKWYDDNPTPIASNQTAGETENNNKCHYIGMDASLLHLHQIWKRELYSRPYHGILAFHQGTVLANILLLSQKLENCEFVIFASGYTLNNPPPGRGCMGLPPEYFIDPELPFRIDSSSSTRSHSDIHTNIDNSNDEARKEITTSRKRNHNNMNSRDTTNEERLFNTGSQHIRSLHLIGKKCTRIHPEKSLRLALRFYNAQVYEHCFANDYSFPNRARDINVIGKVRTKNYDEVFGYDKEIVLIFVNFILLPKLCSSSSGVRRKC